MEIILSVLFISGIIGWFKSQDSRACNYMNNNKIYFRKMNDDRLMNDLSNSQVNHNVLNGKYDKRK